MKPTYDYPTAFKSWGPEEREAAERVWDSDFLTMGPETEAFENELAAHQGRKHAIAVNSGSSANLIAVAAIFNLITRSNDRDRFSNLFGATVPALAWATTYAPLAQHGFMLGVEDCDNTWNRNSILDIPHTIHVGCSILGIPADLSKIQNKCDAQGSYLFNDNCEALGASHNGKPTGAYGDVATCSFFHSHQLSAIEGGAVLTDDDQIARMCRILRDHGATRSVDKPTCFEDEYNFVGFGYNVRPAEINMAIAREQLKKLEQFRQARVRNWHHFASLTTGLPIQMPYMPPFEGSPFGIHFTLDNPAARTRLVTALRANSIDCRLPTGGSFTKHEYGLPWRDQLTPNADRIHDTGMFIGNAPYDIPVLVEKAAKVMRETLT